MVGDTAPRHINRLKPIRIRERVNGSDYTALLSDEPNLSIGAKEVNAIGVHVVRVKVRAGVAGYLVNVRSGIAVRLVGRNSARTSPPAEAGTRLGQGLKLNGLLLTMGTHAVHDIGGAVSGVFRQGHPCGCEQSED